MARRIKTDECRPSRWRAASQPTPDRHVPALLRVDDDNDELGGTRVETHGLHVEMRGRRFEMRGTDVEMRGTDVEMHGTDVEMRGRHEWTPANM